MSASSGIRTLEIKQGEVTCRLDLIRAGDRWSHRIQVMPGDGNIATLESIEGTARDNWPSSPPFQELSIESRGGQSVALLVGMSGKSHWSASVTELIDEHRLGWEFDVACLAKQAPETLGSRYRLLQRSDDLEVNAVSGCQTRDIAENELQLAPELTRIEVPQTICWKYQIVTILR